MIESYSRGHEINYQNGKWYFTDDSSLVNYEKPCPRCGKPSTAEGHDQCLGHIQGMVSVCCGHGVHDPIMMKGDQ